MSLPSVIDTSLLGSLIAFGGEHRVYHYGEDQVIKFPFGPRFWLSPNKYCENLKRDEEVIRSYFGKYLVERNIIFYSKKSKQSYVIIEPKVTGRHLLKVDLADQNVYKQFREMVEINNRLTKQDHLSVEFFGLRGLLFKGKTEAANVMINTKLNKLVITDAGVMHFGRNQEQQIFLSWLTEWGMRRQQKLMNYYLKR